MMKMVVGLPSSFARVTRSQLLYIELNYIHGGEYDSSPCIIALDAKVGASTIDTITSYAEEQGVHDEPFTNTAVGAHCTRERDGR